MLKKVQDSQYTYTGGPEGHFLLGSLPDLKKDPIKFLSDNSYKYGDLIDFRVGRGPNIQLNHPDLIEYVLLGNHKNYKKSDKYLRFEEYLGLGLLTSNGEKWKKDRQMMQPLFSREYIEGIYSDTVANVLKEIKVKWTQDSKSSQPVNITNDMSYITMSVALKTLFGNDIAKEQFLKLHSSMNAIVDYISLPRPIQSYDTNKFIMPKRYRAAQDGLKLLSAYVKEKMLHDKTGSRNDAILALLQRARYTDGSPLSEQDIIDHSITMIFAGYETTSMLLQWTWYILSQHPDAAQKLRKEITESQPDIDKVSFGDIYKLEYLDMVYKESARLYPSFWVNSRAPIEDDVIGGYEVKANTSIIIPVLGIQRHPKWWQEPDSFVPERFSKEKESMIPVGAYLPFSLGPRKCIGARFAEMEVKMVLAKLLPYFTLEFSPNQSREFMRGAISLKKEDDMQMFIKSV